MLLSNFHDITRTWFKRTFKKPTESQLLAWPAIKGGKHTLIAAPTGSGKTLAAFLAIIDDLLCQRLNNGLPDQTQIVYVSPLKALSNDIHRNLEVPLKGIKEEFRAQGLTNVSISTAIRTGDTSQNDRQKMIKVPPHILITTPESLYLLLTSESGRKLLGNVRILIIDEIHAIVGDKRGSHLALSVERLEALINAPLQRIGLSATQKPIQTVARFLVGNHNIKKGNPDCTIIDTGHRQQMALHLEMPRSPLTAIMSNEVWEELYERLVNLIHKHRTTLVFVNTRRLAERLALALCERVGEHYVSSHHGSMSKEHRHEAEKNLKTGKLKVLVATASMELGIDIGSVDLVVQFSSPRSIATFLQRIGRSGHHVGGIPKGVLFPLSRDDLVECTALLYSVRCGELDHITIPEQPIDILAQQIVAEVAGQDWEVTKLFERLKRAYPYRELSEKRFLEVVQMLAEGFSTRRGRRGAHLHYDAINGRLRARRGARLNALTNGGTIPDMFDYEVVLQPEGITVGSINEDYALESLPGDIFTLGTHAWQIQRVEGLKVLVNDAAGLPPTIPFWFGEGPGRTVELSTSISKLRQTISELLEEDPLTRFTNPKFLELDDNKAVCWLKGKVGIQQAAAEQLVFYLSMGKIGLGVMPTRETIVMERFFDEMGDMHVVIHSLYGSRVNRGWGLALRKKFCRNFNFELQAAATDDNIILSLSSSHSFPLEEVFRYLNTKTLRETLIQAMLDAPMFEVRWRWNATRALAIQRNRGGKRLAPPLQRLQAEDLVAQVFPDQIACFENIEGEREIPDHPLVNQTIHDCLTEAMDIDELETLIRRIEEKRLCVIAKDLREPSVFAQEVIHARPYAFLDDTEFVERRVNAIRNRNWLDPTEASDLGKLDQAAIKRVRKEAWPQAETVDELHDILTIFGCISAEEGRTNQWGNLFSKLVDERRATRLIPGEVSTQVLWIASERIPMFKAVFLEARFDPEINLPQTIKAELWSFEKGLKEIVRGRLEALGPVIVPQLANQLGIVPSKIEQSLIALEIEGFVIRGRFTPDLGAEEWCERRLLHRIHRYTIDALRKSIEPVCVQDYIRFLFEAHHFHRSDEQTGPETLTKILDQLEGFAAPAVAWEGDLIPSRIAHYDPLWLDTLCLSGRIQWGRFHPSKPPQKNGKKPGPVKSSPICLMNRVQTDFWRKISRFGPVNGSLSSSANIISEFLEKQGACFFDDIISKTNLLKAQIEDGIAELVSLGLVTSDSYSGLRSLLTPSHAKRKRRRKNRANPSGLEQAGRWSLIQKNDSLDQMQGQGSTNNLDFDTLEKILWIYLKRWRVIFRTILEKETFAPPWRILVRVLRRLELGGKLRGGRFISGVSGEQFALPETVENLRKIRKQKKTGKWISISAADPLNLLGIILPGKKLSNFSSNRILFEDGLPIAILEGGEVKILKKAPPEKHWEIRQALIYKKHPTKLNAYLGKR